MDADLAEIGFKIQAVGINDALAALDELQKKGRAIQTELNRAPKLKPENSAFKTLTKDLAPLWEINPLLEKIGLTGTTLGEGLARTFGSAFEKFLIGGKEAGDLLKSLEMDLVKLGGQLLGSSGGSRKSTGGGTSAFQSIAGDFLTNLFPGYASGGQFTVGGAAGQDRNLVGLRLSRGERVTVETPKMQKENGAAASSQTVNLSFNISTPDAESFRRSQSQIQGEALRSAQRILRRNG